MHRDIAEYCQRCVECQKCRKFKSTRAPMPLPIMRQPFSLIAMDMVGPLPRSRSGNKYVLVLCDYATRYPEAIPIKNTDTETVAEELLALFSRAGIQNEILTDQGSNFQSQILKELYRLLRVDAIRTSQYHPQTDGLVERFNQTLKAMLKKTASEEGKDWDKLIPFVLFAYREVPVTLHSNFSMDEMSEDHSMFSSSPGSRISIGTRTLCHCVVHSAAEREVGENAGDRPRQSQEGEVAAKDMV